MPFGSARNTTELMCFITVGVSIDTDNMLNDLSIYGTFRVFGIIVFSLCSLRSILTRCGLQITMRLLCSVVDLALCRMSSYT